MKQCLNVTPLMSGFEVNYVYHHNCLDLTHFHKLKREKKSLYNINKSLVFNFLKCSHDPLSIYHRIPLGGPEQLVGKHRVLTVLVPIPLYVHIYLLL